MMQSVKERGQTAKRFVETPITTAYSQNSAMASHNIKSAKLEPVDLNDIVQETKWLLPLYGKGDTELILALSEERLPVLVDRSLIKEVLVDLVANISEVIPNGATLTLRTRCVKFESSESGGCVHLSMSDGGNNSEKRTQGGMNQSLRAKVTNMSVGVGLSRVFKIIKQQHNGNIRIDGGSGNGGTVNIFLPLFRKDLGAAQA